MKKFIATALLLLGPILHATEATAPGPAPVPPPAPVPAPVPTLEARCARAFGDHAVFQQNKPIPVWGWTLPQAKVEVTFGSQKKSTMAGADGAWKVTLDPLPADKLASVNEAPAGHTLTIVTRLDGAEATKMFSDILIGEVWLCSGQSNMGGNFGRDPYPPGSGQQANFPALRVFGENWTVCTPVTVVKFSRVGFCFARELQGKIKVPIGILFAAVGGTSIESWVSKTPDPGKPMSQYEHFIPKILPLAGYAMRGTLWYQGEGNVKDKRAYLPKMKQLVEGWRNVWGQGDFPFYFVQIASIGESTTNNPAGGEGRAEIRNAQFEALSIPNTGMAVTIDIGAQKEHPLNKYDTGLRLARWALHRDYGFADLVPSGPLYKSQKIEGSTIRVLFNYAQNGLMLARKEGYTPPVPTPDAPIPWLSIQAKDGSWHWAEGKIDGTDLLVSSRVVQEPVAVRYAYVDQPAGFNLYNRDGLPASPFTTCGYDPQ